MIFKWIVLVTFFTLTFARPEGGGHSKEHHESYHDPYGKSGEDDYKFWYEVKEKDHYSKELDFGHHESKEDGKVTGHYYVLLPDTRKQKVTYYVDGYSGFVADVGYEGSAEYDKGGYGHGHSKEKHSKEYY